MKDLRFVFDVILRQSRKPALSLAKGTCFCFFPSAVRCYDIPVLPKNQLYYGDNFDVLRRYLRDQSVDLVYLDPPFNSRQDYNVLFAEKDGTRSSSQIMAFEDTWEWNMDAERAYEEIVERGGRVSDAMRAFRTFLGHSDMMAYLAMMAPRLIELHRVLKVTDRFICIAIQPPATT